MNTREQTVLLISDDAGLCAEARRELQSAGTGLRVASVSSVDAARRIVEDAAPSVIVLEEACVACEAEGPRARMPRLDAVVSILAAYAPVVVLGQEEAAIELTALIAAGAADYIGTGGESLSAATDRVKQRLNEARRIAASAPSFLGNGGSLKAFHGGEDFGEILRHELNNPLTGILGNADLLLAELRRKRDGLIPASGVQRLETIAALAVRMRETIRRLSQEWEERQTSGPVP
jgi:signal transduction histidine kinase